MFEPSTRLMDETLTILSADDETAEQFEDRIVDLIEQQMTKRRPVIWALEN